ncbi:hypothetical protein M5689_008050 [Euphorbia peplus]|nr:hypothetical protein M5689_008050 [Euphorbia peplus]
MKRNPMSSRIKFLIIISILVFSINVSCSRRISDDQSMETDKTAESSWHFPARAPRESTGDGTGSVYEVSHRKVPGGPNPLHN